MAIKIDLEKTYDKLKWGFIRERLFSINMPADLVEVILSCITTVSSAILFKEGNMKSILPSRGIRQGDPLSRYLFIPCIDFLGQFIEEKYSQNLW